MLFVCVCVCVCAVCVCVCVCVCVAVCVCGWPERSELEFELDQRAISAICRCLTGQGLGHFSLPLLGPPNPESRFLALPSLLEAGFQSRFLKPAPPLSPRCVRCALCAARRCALSMGKERKSCHPQYLGENRANLSLLSVIIMRDGDDAP